MEQNKSELLKWFIGLFFVLALMIIGLYIKNNFSSFFAVVGMAKPINNKKRLIRFYFCIK
jgi:hypothetical protein